jgi:two-component system alkaline phosphatase synthesis response regulator PhoP
VLIVDDEPDILLMLRVSLEASGYETGLAADGDVALQRVRQEPFDLILLDVMMPVLDGWGVLEALQREAAPPPVIVVSAKSASRDIDRAIELGAIEYITKPFEIERLIDRIAEVLAEKSGRPQSSDGARGRVGFGEVT